MLGNVVCTMIPLGSLFDISLYFAVSKWPVAGQGLQITKLLAVELFPIILEICEYLSIENSLFSSVSIDYNVVLFPRFFFYLYFFLLALPQLKTALCPSKTIVICNCQSVLVTISLPLIVFKSSLTSLVLIVVLFICNCSSLSSVSFSLLFRCRDLFDSEKTFHMQRFLEACR